MSKKYLHWMDGTILQAAHLQIAQNEAYNYAYSLSKIVNNYLYGIIDLEIDKIALIDGVLRIISLKCVFQDGNYVEYDHGDYILEFNILEKYGKISTQDMNFYLVNTGEIIVKEEIVFSNNIETKVWKKQEKLIITNLQQNHSLLIANIFWNKTAFDYTQNADWLLLPVNTSFMKELNLVILKLKNQLSLMKERNSVESSNLLLSQSISQLVYYLISLMNIREPKKLYDALIVSLGYIAWYHSGQISIPVYQHHRSIEILNELLLYIGEILNINRDIGVDLIRTDEKLSTRIPRDIDSEMFIIIEPNTEEIRNWILNTQISSTSYFHSIKIDRILGIKREIVYKNNNSSLIVRIYYENSEYFVNGEDLHISMPNIYDLKVDKIRLSMKSKV